MTGDIEFIAADWPAPAGIRAGTTARTGGVSQAPYESLNLGANTGDAPEDVIRNRAHVAETLALPDEPAWLTQVHGAQVIDPVSNGPRAADASVSGSEGAVCVVLTADCLPVLFCDYGGTCRGAAHAGWRGLVGGVLEATIARLDVAPAQLMAWLGPAIGRDVFEVGQDVHDAFCATHPEDRAAFVPGGAPGKYLADIYHLARARLNRAGVSAVYGGGFCTYSDTERFYSYRRDGQTGRMASLIWRETT